MTRDTPAAIGQGVSSLRREMTLAGSAMVVIVLVIAAVVIVTLRVQTIAGATRSLAAVSHVTAERTAQTFSAADILVRSLQDLATKQPLTDAAALRDRAGTQAFYNSVVGLRKLLPQISVAAIMDADGQVLSSSDQYPAPNVNIGSVPLFKTLKDGRSGGFAISDPLYDAHSDQWAVYLGRSLTDAQGRFAGIALVGIQISYFEGYFSMIDSGPSAAISLVNDRLIMVAHWPHVAQLTGKPLPATGFGRLPAIGDTSIVRFRGPADRGATRRAAVTRLSVQDMSLYLVISETEHAMLAPWRNAIVWVAVFTAISLTVLGLLAWFVYRAIREEELWRAAVLERETRLSNQALDLAAARDAAEAASRVRGEFLANMSHELRTPLNAVLGFSEIMEKELFGPLGDPRYREFVADIHNSGKHLLEVVGNILDLTKIDAGKLQLDEQEVDVVEIMQICGRLMTEAANNAKITLEIRPPEHPVILLADPTRLRQILLNLLSNAIKFTAKGGVVASGQIWRPERSY
jgi:signal transduction histidine kinase